jgi:hypothetical protein
MSDTTGSSIHERWIAFVTADDRSGTLTALTEMFSSRGVSFTSFSTLSVADGTGVMSIIFPASERLARVLARTLDRLAVTRTVSLVRAADPGVRAVAVVAGTVPLSGTACTVMPWGADGTLLVAGAFAEVEDAVSRMRSAGAVVESLTVLPPR